MSLAGETDRTAFSSSAVISGGTSGKRTAVISGLYMVTSRASWSVTVAAFSSTTPAMVSWEPFSFTVTASLAKSVL